MRTKLTIVAIVLGGLLAAAAIFVVASLEWGVPGFAFCVTGAVLVLTTYVRFVRPWHARWGATEREAGRPMPGDDIIPDAASTTRAISIACPPDELWLWLVQIGYGRAGWYSYDWIDNDGKQSADRVIPELQNMRPGDHIEMLPGWGPEVVDVVPNCHFVAGDGEGGTWCLAIYPTADGSRLVSRWRQNWTKSGIGSWFFISLADPGAFIMEQKMLRGIKRRAECAHRSLNQSLNANPDDLHEEVA